MLVNDKKPVEFQSVLPVQADEKVKKDCHSNKNIQYVALGIFGAAVLAGIYYSEVKPTSCLNDFNLCLEKCSEESKVHLNTWQKEREITDNALMNAADRAEWTKLVNEREQSKRNMHEKNEKCGLDCLAKLNICYGR